MAQTCLGLVIGSRKLKAVELSSRFGELSLNRYWLIDLPENFREALFGISSPPEDGLRLPEEINEFLIQEKEIALSLPSELFFYREIEFPFADLKKIQQVIRLEAEDYFPFEMDGYLLEFLPPLSQNHSTNVLTFALKRDQLSQILSSLNTLGIDPAFSGIECLTLPLLSLNQPALPRLWLEIGTHRTILLGAVATVPFLYRRIPLGVNSLLEKLTKELGISLAQAEQVILQADLSQPEEKISATEGRIISEWCSLLISKVNETLHWFERNRKEGLSLGKFEELILAGNGALIKGLDHFFSQSLNLSCNKFHLPNWFKQEIELPPEKALLLAEPLSLALARLRREGKKIINFRKGEFAWKMEFQIPYRRLVFPAILIVLMAGLGLVKAYGQHRLMKQRKEQLQKEMLTQCQKLLPNCSATDPLQQLSRALSTAQSKQTVYLDLLYPSAITTLSAIADQLPEGAVFTLSRYNYSKDKARVEGETADFASAKELVDRLNKVEFFKKVILEDSRSNPSGKVNFSIQIELKSAGEKSGGQ